MPTNRLFLMAACFSALACFATAPAQDHSAAARAKHAQKLLETEAWRVSLDRQEQATIAKFYSQVGRKLYEAFEYEKAREVLEKSLEHEPNNKEGQKYLRLTRRVLGVRIDRSSEVTLELGCGRVKIQDQIIELENNYFRGRAFLNEAMRAKVPSRSDAAHYITALAKLDLADARFERAREIIKWMPYNVDLSSHEALNRRFQKRADCLRKNIFRLLAATRNQPRDGGRPRGKRRPVADRRRIDRLEGALPTIDRGNYEQAEKLANDVLARTPHNLRAKLVVAIVQLIQELNTVLARENLGETEKEMFLKRLIREIEIYGRSKY